ncbi:J domain-containing protein [Synechococcus sp. RSCCF101]|nr:J domain-containing protein [Synechococcus sp. RSCCF101]
MAARAPPLSYYQLLNVSPEAGAGELRQAFRTLSKRYHPDTTSLPAAEASARFQLLQRAYATLLDPERRQAYDEALRRLSQPVPVQRRVVTVASSRRDLSGGEWFALLLLAVALLFSLVIGLGLAWARGVQLVTTPSWGSAAPAQPVSAASADRSADVVPAAPTLARSHA